MQYGIKQQFIKKEFDSEPVHSDKYIKTKIKIYNNKINTNFDGNKIPKIMNFVLDYL